MKRRIFIPLIALFAATMTACGGGSGKSGLKHGDTAVVTEQCIGAVDEDSYEQMLKYCNRRDERGLELMEARGLITILEEGETGVVTEMGFGKTKIRLLDDREYWCSSKFVK